MKVKLKVCGITTYEDACTSIEVGAEYLGFNFYPPSPRYISPDAARDIILKLPDEIISVGVFVNEPTPEYVVEKMLISCVNIAQLHGDEDEVYCRKIGAERVIKALRPGKSFAVEDVIGYPAAALLLDAYDKKLFGGTGKIGNWEAASEIAKFTSVFLAGGLAPENIGEAIRAVRPYAIDVNSGVETYPGRKDKTKLQALRFALNV